MRNQGVFLYRDFCLKAISIAIRQKGEGAIMPNLKSVIRFDSMPMPRAYFTPEGYLKDRPILTSCGIFEYMDNGKVRRELRLPEDVFSPDSLSSYLGKPVVLTHDAGLIDKDNVADNQIGTILSKGERSGDDVKAEIIIHDTDAMKSAGLKELSLGYNLDLDETPGVWNGQRYDAVQKNIRINHLALVREARAGEQARLNLDGRAEKTILTGGKNMTKKNTKRTSRVDAILSDEEFEKAVEEYKKKRAEKTDAEDVEKKVEVEVETPEGEFGEVEKKVAEVKERRDRRDEQGDPKDVDEAMGMIAHQDEDLDTLFDLIDTLLAKLNFDAAEEEKEEVVAEEEFEEDEVDDLEKLKGDEDDLPEDEEEIAEDEDEEEIIEGEEEEELVEDADDEEEEVIEEEEFIDEELPEEEEEEYAEDEDDEEEELPDRMNMDSIDRIVSQKLRMDKLGEAVGISGLGHKSIGYAKRAIIKKVRPGIRLDGKSDAYINACFDMAKNEIKKNSKKDTSYQKRQMFNKNARLDSANMSGSEASRRNMVKRQMNHGK